MVTNKFVFDTMHGPGEAVRENGVWEISTPWGTRIFAGSLTQARAEARAWVRDETEAEDASSDTDE